MAISFLPGEPNRSSQASSFVNWNSIQILAYCSGNNLVILTKNGHHLQTIYLPFDSFSIDINSRNGKIAIGMKNMVYIYNPKITNFYSFNFGGRKNIDDLGIEWELETKIVNGDDDSSIHCISWSDMCEKSSELDENDFMGLPQEFDSQTNCELVTGSGECLTLWRIYYKKINDKITVNSKKLWHKDQPNPVYMAKFSPNASCIASVGLCDNLIKLWYRLSYGIENSEFVLYYISVPKVVTDLRWKAYTNMDSIVGESGQVTDSSSSLNGSLTMYKTSNSIVKLDLSNLNVPSDRRSIASLISDKKQHNVLYTICSDSILRVYSTYKLDTGFKIFQNGSIDMYEGESKDTATRKFVTFVDNGVVDYGISTLLHKMNTATDEISGKRQALMDLLQSKLEVCIVFDSAGNCKLYYLGNLCLPIPSEMSIYHMDMHPNDDGTSQRCHVKFSYHCMPCDCRSISILPMLLTKFTNQPQLSMAIQDLFKNSIRIVNFTFESIFNIYAREQSPFMSKVTKVIPQAQSLKTIEIGLLQDKLTGHQKSIQRLIKSTDGSSVLSTTRFNESFLWFMVTLGTGRTTLNKKSAIVTPSPVIDATIWLKGNYVITLVDGKLICYDCRLKSQFHTRVTKLAPKMCSKEVTVTGKIKCFMLLPETSKKTCHIILINDNAECQCWQVSLSANGDKAQIDEFSIDNLPDVGEEKLHILSAIDPVGWKESIDFSGRDVLCTITTNGFLRLYSATIADDGIHWNTKNSFMTGIQSCSYVSGSSANKVAIASKDANILTIWDVRLGTLAYEEDFGSDIIRDIDWTATEYHQAILAVGFRLHSFLYTQLRYDYTNQSPTFAKIKKVSISEQTTHNIGDSVWMMDGLLVMGSGNQFYISDKALDADNDEITNRAIGTFEIVSNDLFHLCAALNGPLPIYHPQFIIQFLFTGRFTVIEVILMRLARALRNLELGKSKVIDISLDLSYQDLLMHQDEANDGKQMGTYHKLFDAINGGKHSENERFTANTADMLVSMLQKYKLPYLTGHQQITLSYTISIIKDILLKYRNILDYNALRFYIGMKLFQINLSKSGDPLAKIDKTITMRDVSFAMHSDNRDLLYNLINEQVGMKIDWITAKRYGLPYWLNLQKLTIAMESIARNEFLKYEDQHDGARDPSKCAIFYMALKKKQILLGLWKTAIGHPEQSKMIKFLSHDFDEVRWRRAATKNAYVLMSKHRYSDAAYFFLLAKSVTDCVDVIVEKMHDVPLAIAVSRAYEQSDHSDSLKHILVREVIPRAIDANNRWYLSWCFWAFKSRPGAIQSLIKPIEDIIEDIKHIIPEFSMPKGYDVHKINSANNEDPVLLVMYHSLRNRNVLYLEGARKLKPEVEFNFVVKVATMYQSMGCDWISVMTTRNWKFTSSIPDKRDDTTVFNNDQSRSTPPLMTGGPSILDSFKGPKQHTTLQPSQVPSMLDSFTTPTKAPKTAKKNTVKPPTSAFAEPDMSAFSFGF